MLLSKDGHELTSNYVRGMRERFAGSETLGDVDQLPAVLRGDPRTIVVTTRPQQQVERIAQRHLIPLFTYRRTTLYRVSD